MGLLIMLITDGNMQAIPVRLIFIKPKVVFPSLEQKQDQKML